MVGGDGGGGSSLVVGLLFGALLVVGLVTLLVGGGGASTTMATFAVGEPGTARSRFPERACAARVSVSVNAARAPAGTT